MAKSKPAALMYQLHIRLVDSDPEIWRRVLVPADFDLQDLHYVIQNAFEWNHAHLFQFCQSIPWCGTGLYPPADEDGGIAGPDENGEFPPAPKLAEILPVGGRLFYVYDFGDNWGHEVFCEGLMVKPPKIRLPRCIDGANGAAFEDCGGTDAYNRIVAILSDRDNPEHKEEMAELVRYYGKRILKYNPAAFDPKKVRM